MGGLWIFSLKQSQRRSAAVYTHAMLRAKFCVVYNNMHTYRSHTLYQFKTSVLFEALCVFRIQFFTNEVSLSAFELGLLFHYLNEECVCVGLGF